MDETKIEFGIQFLRNKKLEKIPFEEKEKFLIKKLGDEATKAIMRRYKELKLQSFPEDMETEFNKKSTNSQDKSKIRADERSTSIIKTLLHSFGLISLGGVLVTAYNNYTQSSRPAPSIPPQNTLIKPETFVEMKEDIALIHSKQNTILNNLQEMKQISKRQGVLHNEDTSRKFILNLQDSATPQITKPQLFEEMKELVENSCSRALNSQITNHPEQSFYMRKPILSTEVNTPITTKNPLNEESKTKSNTEEAKEAPKTDSESPKPLYISPITEIKSNGVAEDIEVDHEQHSRTEGYNIQNYEHLSLEQLLQECLNNYQNNSKKKDFLQLLIFRLNQFTLEEETPTTINTTNQQIRTIIQHPPALKLFEKCGFKQKNNSLFYDQSQIEKLKELVILLKEQKDKLD